MGASLHSEDHQALKLFGPPGFHMFDCNGRDKYWPFYINCTVITTGWDCNIYCLYAILMAMTMQWNGTVTFLLISLVRVPSKSPPLPPTSILPHLRHFPHSLHLLYYFLCCTTLRKTKNIFTAKKKHVLAENLLQPPHLPHSTFNLPSSKKPPDTGYHGCNQGHLENRISLFMIGSLHDNWQFCALRTWLSSRKDWWEKLLVALLANHHPARPDHHPSQELNTILTSGLTVRQWSWSLAWKSTDLYLYRWFMSEIRHHDRGRK